MAFPTTVKIALHRAAEVAHLVLQLRERAEMVDLSLLIECRDRFGAGDLAARGAAWREGQVWVDLAQDGSTISPPLLTSATIRSGCARYRLRLRSSPTPSARNVLRGLTSERLRQRGGPDGVQTRHVHPDVDRNGGRPPEWDPNSGAHVCGIWVRRSRLDDNAAEGCYERSSYSASRIEPETRRRDFCGHRRAAPALPISTVYIRSIRICQS